MSDISKESSTDEKYAGRVRQSSIYLGKFLRIFMAEKQWAMIIMAGIIAFLVSTVVGRNMFITMEGTLLGAFAISCVCIWNGIFNSIQVVCKERAIIKREHRSGLSIFSYLSAHVGIQFTLCVIQALVTIVIMSLSGINFPATGLLGIPFVIDYAITLVLITFASDMLGLMVSCMVKTTTMAMTVMPFVLIVQLLFSGAAFPLSGTMAKFSDFTIAKWGIDCICIDSNYNTYKTYSIYNQLYKIGKTEPMVKKAIDLIGKDKITEYASQHAQNAAYSYDLSKLLHAWLMLGIFIVVCGVVGLIFLEFVDKDKR